MIHLFKIVQNAQNRFKCCLNECRPRLQTENRLSKRAFTFQYEGTKIPHTHLPSGCDENKNGKPVSPTKIPQIYLLATIKQLKFRGNA